MKLFGAIHREEATAKECAKENSGVLMRRSHHSTHLTSSGSFALARIVTTLDESEDHLYQKAPNGNILALAGSCYSINQSPEELVKKAVPLRADAAVEEITRNLEGAFCAVHWDAENQTVTIITDPMGIYPIYQASDDNGIHFSSEIKPLTRLSRDHSRVSAPGLAAWLKLGNTHGQLSLADRVFRMDGGSIFQARAGDTEFAVRRYWSQPVQETGKRSPEALWDLAVELEREIAAINEQFPENEILLSGGFDSRLIATVLNKQGINVRLNTVSHPDEYGDLDSYLATRFARSLGRDITRHSIDPSSQEKASFLDYMIESELAQPSLGIFIASVIPFVTPDKHAVWHGLGPACLNHFSYVYPDMATLVASKRNNETPEIKALSGLFDPAFAEALTEEWQQLENRLVDQYGDGPDNVLNMNDNGRWRHRASMIPMKVMANDVAPLMPCFSRPFRESLSYLPLEMRMGPDSHCAMLRHYFPSGARVPAISGGVLHKLDMRAGPMAANIFFRKQVLGNWRVKKLLGLNRPAVHTAGTNPADLIPGGPNGIEFYAAQFGLRPDIINKVADGRASPLERRFYQFMFAYGEAFCTAAG